MSIYPFLVTQTVETDEMKRDKDIRPKPQQHQTPDARPLT